MGVMSEQVKEVLAVEIYDKDGHEHLLGDLVKGKKTAILFVRHFCERAMYVLICRKLMRRVRQLSSLCQTPQRGPASVRPAR